MFVSKSHATGDGGEAGAGAPAGDQGQRAGGRAQGSKSRCRSCLADGFVLDKSLLALCWAVLSRMLTRVEPDCLDCCSIRGLWLKAEDSDIVCCAALADLDNCMTLEQATQRGAEIRRQVRLSLCSLIYPVRTQSL